MMTDYLGRLKRLSTTNSPARFPPFPICEPLRHTMSTASQAC
jgi:hypothetical protein